MAILNVLEDSPTEWTTTKEEGLKDALQDGTTGINTSEIQIAGVAKSFFNDNASPVLAGNLDLSTYGVVIGSQTVSTDAATGDIVRFDGSSWTAADASASTSADGFIGLKTASDTVLVKGSYTTSGLVAGNTYYLSTVAGETTDTAPSSSGEIVRILGYALSTTRIYFDPDKSYIEVS